jgi:methyl-accepting chemotaxis protein
MVNLRGATLIVSSVILIAFAILALTLIDTSERLEGQATKIGMSGYGARLATELKTQVLLHNRRSFLYSMKKTQALEQNVEIGRQRIWHLLEEAAHFLGSKEEEVLFSEVKMGVAAYLEKRDQLQKEKLSSVDRYDQASKYVERSFESIDRFIELNIVEMTDGLDSTHAVNKVAKQRALIILFIGFILVIGIIFFIFFSILRPLSNLAAIIANYGTENSTAISDVKGVREIQSIFLHLQSMAQRLEKTALDLAKERLKLERSNRELEQFAGVAAHDFRSTI